MAGITLRYVACRLIGERQRGGFRKVTNRDVPIRPRVVRGGEMLTPHESFTHTTKWMGVTTLCDAEDLLSWESAGMGKV
jgi:hypothetical protein